MTSHTLFWIVGSLFALAALYGLHRLGLWMEQRGWIYYSKGGGGSAIGNALQQANFFFDPAIQHTIDAQYEKEREQDDQDDPIDPMVVDFENALERDDNGRTIV